MRSPAELLQWTAWRPLDGASRDPDIPRLPGLYRIRRVGRDDLDYIGQTGLALHNASPCCEGCIGTKCPTPIPIPQPRALGTAARSGM